MNEINFDQFTKKEIVGMYSEPAKEIPIIADMDVLVVGGSPSGVAAAVCAARGGAKVQLVERFGFLGGQNVFSSVTQWEKRAFINNLGAVITKGIAKEMLDRIVEKGNSDGLWETPPGCEEMRDGEEWLDVHDIQVAMIEICEEAGVEVLLHTLAVDVIVESAEENERMHLPRLKGVIFENKTGRFAYTANTIIDATADVDLVWKAIGEEGVRIVPPMDRVGAGFYIYYGGVDSEKFIEYVISSNTVKGYPSPRNYPDKLRMHFKEGKLIKLGGFDEILEKADELGLFEKVEEILSPTNALVIITLGMKWVGHNLWCASLTGLQNLNLLDTWELSKYEMIRTKLEDAALHIFRLMPGWQNAYIARNNIYMGQRQTRNLQAKYMLTEKDIFEPDHDRADVIGRSGAHDPGKNKLKKAYPIPYGILVPEKLDGVLVCCRGVGCGDHTAVNAHRGITPTIVVGQAAGTAAAICSQENTSPHTVNLKEVQEKLKQADVILGVETMEYDFEIKNGDKAMF